MTRCGTKEVQKGGGLAAALTEVIFMQPTTLGEIQCRSSSIADLKQNRRFMSDYRRSFTTSESEVSSQHGETWTHNGRLRDRRSTVDSLRLSNLGNPTEPSIGCKAVLVRAAIAQIGKSRSSKRTTASPAAWCPRECTCRTSEALPTGLWTADVLPLEDAHRRQISSEHA